MEKFTEFSSLYVQKLSILFVLATLCSVKGYAQDTTISGTVTDNQSQPIPGASIVVKGTTSGVATDFDGNYNVSASSGDILVFSYIGFETKEVEVDNQTIIDVVLTEDISQLEEVVVIGYGTVRKKDLTGSVSSIKTDEINQTPTARVDDALRGKVAGLQITPTSSQPGAAATVRIRGSNSISANNEPLYVIDGFIGGFNLNDINPNDIASIEVLKDASATAIYGSRGSNGVIIITTKRGKVGRMELTYDTYTGIQSPTRFLDMMNAAEYAEWINEINSSEVYENPQSLGEGTDWQKEIFRNNALIQSHTLSLSGGNEKSRFFMSINSFDQNGLSINSNLDRKQFKLNTDHQVSPKIKIGNSLLISRNKRTPGYHNTNSIQIAGWDPTIPVRDENGDFTFQVASSELTNDNPVALATLREDLTTQTRTIGNVYGEYEIINGLKFKISGGVNLLNENRKRYNPSTLYEERSTSGTATLNNRERLDLLLENTLNYNKTFDDHNVSGLLGYTSQKITEFSNLVQVQGFVTDAFSYNNLGAAAQRLDANSNNVEQRLESYLFRVNYGYKNKYLFTASARLDGSSVFAENNKWGLFPSAAVAWRAIEEGFVKNLKVFDDLKFRASYGILGNPGVDPGASLSRLDTGGNNYIFGVEQSLAPGIAPNTLGNPNLKWETTTQFDVGVDASFFDNSLQFTLDYYSKTTKDLLVNVPLLWLTSFDDALSNFGEVSNKGLELSLNSTNIDTGNFRWQTNFNIATNKNNIESIDAPDGFILINGIGNIGFPSGILRAGIPLGSFHGLVYEGIWNDQAEIDAAGVTGETVFPGGRRYKDLDGNGIIEVTEDRQVIGNPNPDFYGGLGNTFFYKGFELYVYLNFVYGNDILNETQTTLGVAFDNNVPVRYVNRWTPTNTGTDVPSSAAVTRPLITSNSGIIEDGSFLRVRNINFAYNLPMNGDSWIRKAKVYLQGTNLFLLDNYSGYDPDINRGTDNTRRGYDNAQDPVANTVSLGLTLGF